MAWYLVKYVEILSLPFLNVEHHFYKGMYNC